MIKWFEKGVNENDIHNFLRAYTHIATFSTTFNRHLASYILFYFGSTLDDTIDYQLIKCLIDFVALLIYLQELQPYLFSGIVYRGVLITESDLLKYVLGSRIMNITCLSTSKDKQLAEFFSGKGQQEFSVIYNRNNRRAAIDISSI